MSIKHLLKIITITGMVVTTTLTVNITPSFSQSKDIETTEATEATETTKTTEATETTKTTEATEATKTTETTETTETTDKVTFFCNQIYDPASGQKIPATLAWIPQRQKNVRLIGWKSNYFDKIMTPEQRCQKITKKFQDKYNSGDLNYINFGKAKGYPIVCGLKNEADPCDGNSQIFTLKPFGDHNSLKKALNEILEGKASDIIMQSSRPKSGAIPFMKLINRLPSVEK